jgi:transposase
MSYSIDLRTRVIASVLGGQSRIDASKIFQVHYQTVKEWVKRYLETGEVAPRKAPPSNAGQLNLEELRQDVQLAPDSFQSERATRLGVTQPTISRGLSKLGMTRKKKTTCYLEQDEEQKQEFQTALSRITDQTMLVFLDECGIPQNLYREYGWAPEGDRVLGKRTGKRERKLNLIAGYSNLELKAPFLYEGVMNTELFNFYLTQYLLPVLKPGQLVVMDNASFHKSTMTRQLIESKGCQLWFLPPYSPELNPIFHLWAVLKRYVRRFQTQFHSLTETLDFLFQSIPLFKGSETLQVI